MKTRKLMQAVASVTAVIATMGVSLDTLAATKADHDKEVIGYVTEWDQWKDSAAGVPAKGLLNHMNVPVDKYTILNWSFFGLAQDGSLHSGDYRNKNIWKQGQVQAPADLLHTDIYGSWDLSMYFGDVEAVYTVNPKDEALIARIEAQGLVIGANSWSHPASGIGGQFPVPVKVEGGAPGIIEHAHANGTKVMASLGGWSMSKHFPEVMANASLRARFIEDCVKLIDMGFDGIDIDWEYPGNFGMNIFAHDPHENYEDGRSNDHKNFEIMMSIQSKIQV